MEKVKYKDFINLSKYVVDFKGHSILWKIKFYITAPLRYLIFKKVLKKEMVTKIERKEVK